ncbi:MAG: hypothetical protein Q7S40_23995 [Opitutaceae bacterium]|nr:hypothetical protein [Opitutaceae bacterium]
MKSWPFPGKLIVAVALLAAVWPVQAATTPRTVWVVRDAEPGRAARHGLEKLRSALEARGWSTREAASLAAAGRPRIIAGTTAAGGEVMRRLRESGGALPAEPEALLVKKLSDAGGSTLLLCGHDDRGLMYAALDVAERIGWTAAGPDPFAEVRDVSESPFVRDRSLSVYTMNRAHWESRFYDERYWTRYFDLLASTRFNRFLIVFGYENGGFLAPPYPYLFDTPGFDGVRMVGLTPEQQRRNLAALNRLIELAHDRGIAVSLGIWDHIYRGAVQTGGAEWVGEYKGRSVPNSVEGVTAENLNAYTLAALKVLLARVPALDALQFRVHEESGLKRSEMEGFWREVFQHVQKQKPGMLLEARGKGTPDAVIDTAIAQGVNLRIETKYWMEQMGLPFHPTHVNRQNQHDRRHGYADFLRYPQRYQMNWRLWNGGTTRVLLWGDPEYVRRYSESAQLYGSPNWDVQEPLATKMEAQRPDMPAFDLMPAKYRHYDYEFERYWHFFQVWGRVGYNPQTPAEVWQHEFQRRFGAAAPHLEGGLQRASQVLPMIVAAVYPYSLFPTTRGWAERQSLGATLGQYAANEGTDVQQFESFADAAKRIVAGGTTPRRTPDATSRWFDATADAILAAVTKAGAVAGGTRSLEFDATVTDLRILAQLARFHARRSIAAVHYNLFKRNLQLGELLAATLQEKEAVAAWRELVAAAGDRYAFDLAMGARNHSLCGHWRDELKKLEANLKELEEQCCPPEEAVLKQKVWQPARAGDHDPPQVEHVRLTTAKVGQPLRLTTRVTDPSGIDSVRLRYRHVTQYEDYATLEMKPTGAPGIFEATVPGEFLVPQWDFMYLVEAIDRAGNGMMWPDLAKEMPYVFVKLERP